MTWTAKRCESCRYWSEMLAKARGRTVWAICLHPRRAQDWRPGHAGCDQWEDGSLGAVDLPTGNPYEAQP